MLLKDIPNARAGSIIDVRTREEYELMHAPGTANIPWDLHLYYFEELRALPLPWIFCCEEGWRSGFVVNSLKMLGFEEVYNLGRWIDVDLERSQLPVEIALFAESTADNNTLNTEVYAPL